MLVDDQQQPIIDISQMLNTDRFSHQTRHSISPLVVHAFGHTGSAAALARVRAMLPGTEESRVDVVAIGINQLFAVRAGDTLPKLAQTLDTSIADKVGQNLPGKAADSNPEIPKLTLLTKADEEFIDLYRVVPDRLYDALAQLNLLHFF